VKIVGWGSTDIDPSLDYWTVQNSWGPTWGMDGQVISLVKRLFYNLALSYE
jgi:hypothetical protein